MGKIKLLPRDVITQIAAGEVIERPASVVKELVENAIDAEASHITISLEEGGVRRITVTDNGHGMDKEDLELCYKPHATSKLYTLSDLQHLSSLGFRGEALSSMAAVSKLTIKSRTETQQTGYAIEVEHGTLKNIQPVGMPVGTQVDIQQLFHSFPARREFLKTPTVEVRAIIKIISHLALAYPAISFTVEHNQETVLHIANHLDLKSRVQAVLGQEIKAGLLPIHHHQEDTSIIGYIAKPQYARPSSVHQSLVINGRVVRHGVLADTIREAYGTLLAPRLYPVFVLNLKLPSSSVDPNVHPRKEEIDIQNEHAVQKILRSVIADTLQKQDLLYRYHAEQAEENTLIQDTSSSPVLSEILRDTIEPWDMRLNRIDPGSEIVQVHRVYLITQTKQGVLIVDQHAAHERILYEQFKDAFEHVSQNNTSYTLVSPKIFNLSLDDATVLEQHQTELSKLGFDIEPFGNLTYKVSTVPALFKDHNISELLLSVLDDLRQHRGSVHLQKVAHKTLAYLACRTAIKAGDILSIQDRRDLLQKLFRTTTQYTCPHGRPVQVELDIKMLDRLFKRI